MTLTELIEETGGAAKVAESVGVSRTAVYQWQAGISGPSTKHLVELHKLSKGRLDLGSLYA